MKKTKRRYLALFLALFLFSSVLTGCSAKAPNKDSGAYAPENETSSDAYNAYMEPEPQVGDASATDLTVTGNGAVQSDKIIYSGYAEVETLHFEDSIDAVYAILERCGGFLESENITGVDYASSYHGMPKSRTANFTLRIPKGDYSDVTTALGTEVGNVTYLSSEASNVSAAYADYESRVTIYRTEEERLLSYLANAQNVEEMLAIEDRLSEVRYQIETYTGYLNNMDSQISYSTLKIRLTEVQALTEDKAPDVPYGKQLSDGFMESLKRVGRFFSNLFRGFVTNLPVLLTWAIVLTLIVLAARHIWKRRDQKRNVPHDRAPVPEPKKNGETKEHESD